MPIRPRVTMGSALLQENIEVGGRSHSQIRGVTENTATPGPHAGGGDEQLDRRAAKTVEIDAVGEDAAQRIEIERIKMIGGEQARHQIERQIARRVVDRPPAE